MTSPSEKEAEEPTCTNCGKPMNGPPGMIECDRLFHAAPAHLLNPPAPQQVEDEAQRATVTDLLRREALVTEIRRRLVAYPGDDDKEAARLERALARALAASPQGFVCPAGRTDRHQCDCLAPQGAKE